MAIGRPTSDRRGDDASFVMTGDAPRLRRSPVGPRWEWMVGPLVGIVVVAVTVIGITRAGSGGSADVPSIAIDCPTSVAIDERLTCTIATDNVVSGSWDLPGFLAGPLQLDTVNDDNPIYVEPTNPDVAGQTFTITATAVTDDGRSVTARHSFEVRAD